MAAISSSKVLRWLSGHPTSPYNVAKRAASALTRRDFSASVSRLRAVGLAFLLESTRSKSTPTPDGKGASPGINGSFTQVLFDAQKPLVLCPALAPARGP